MLESLARGGVMMMTLGDDLNFVFLLCNVFVSSCEWPGQSMLPCVRWYDGFSLVFLLINWTSYF